MQIVKKESALLVTLIITQTVCRVSATLIPVNVITVIKIMSVSYYLQLHH